MHHLGPLSELFRSHLSHPVTKSNQLTHLLWRDCYEVNNNKKKKLFKAIFCHSRYEPNNQSKLQISGTLRINIVLGAKENHSCSSPASSPLTQWEMDWHEYCISLDIQCVIACEWAALSTG